MRDGLNSSVKHERHRANVARKYETLQGKMAILAMWEAKGNLTDDQHRYVIRLRHKIRTIRCNLEAMRPIEDLD